MIFPAENGIIISRHHSENINNLGFVNRQVQGLLGLRPYTILRIGIGSFNLISRRYNDQGELFYFAHNFIDTRNRLRVLGNHHLFKYYPLHKGIEACPDKQVRLLIGLDSIDEEIPKGVMREMYNSKGTAILKLDQGLIY